MVDGHSRQPAAVIDLDGTLYSRNSLRVYLRTALELHVRRLALSRVAVIGALWLARRLGLIGHETMKYRALRAAGSSERLLERFGARMKACVNPAVAERVEACRAAGYRVLLASAAAGFYVPLLWQGEMLVSPEGGPDLRGEAKHAAVARWLDDGGLELRLFMTDHIHDLPLAIEARRRGAEVVIVDPAPRSAAAFAREGFTDFLRR